MHFKFYVCQRYPLYQKTFLLILYYSDTADFTNFHTFLGLLNRPMIIADVCHILGHKLAKSEIEPKDSAKD